MERADHVTLEQTPEGFDIVGMSVPAHILYSGMVHDLMRIGTAKALIPAWLMERDSDKSQAYRRISTRK